MSPGFLPLAHMGVHASPEICAEVLSLGPSLCPPWGPLTPSLLPSPADSLWVAALHPRLRAKPT